MRKVTSCPWWRWAQRAMAPVYVGNILPLATSQNPAGILSTAGWAVGQPSLLHPSGTDVLHLLSGTRGFPPAPFHTARRHQGKQKGSRQLHHAAWTALGFLVPAGTRCPTEQPGLGGVVREAGCILGTLHYHRGQKGGTVLSTLPWTSRLAWALVQPAAILVLKKVSDLQQLGAQSCDEAW